VEHDTAQSGIDFLAARGLETVQPLFASFSLGIYCEAKKESCPFVGQSQRGRQVHSRKAAFKTRRIGGSDAWAEHHKRMNRLTLEGDMSFDRFVD
jgi:hypothetical protein